MTAKYRMALAISALVALVVGAFILSGGQAQAQNGAEKVSGSYNAVFTQFDFLGPDGSFLILSAEITGPFELTIGDDLRVGTLTFPHIARVDPVTGSGNIAGGAAWLFDGGLVCTGVLAGPIIATVFFGEGEFDCSDGTRLSVDLLDIESVPVLGGVAKFDVSGKLRPGGGQ